jgi:hypothetical protein
MNKETIDKLVLIRQNLITTFSRLRDYKNNPNAITKEVEYARTVHKTITQIDDVLKAYVNFEDSK